MLVAILKNEGNYEYAYELLHQIQSKLSFHGKVMLQELAYHQKRFAEALYVGTECFEMFPNAEVAFKNSCAAAQLNKPKDTVGWMKSAMQYGLQDPKSALSRTDFDPVRKSTDFQDYLKNL